MSFKKYNLTTTSFFLFLLPVFFVLHGYSQHLFFLTLSDILVLLITYCACAGFLFILIRIFVKTTSNACLIASLLLSLYLFFGAIQDLLKQFTLIPFLSKFSVLLPVLLALCYWGIKRIINGVPATTVLYFNSLFIILILIDTLTIGWQLYIHKEEKIDFRSCPTCDRPDVYFLLLDGYAGEKQLLKDFSFSNESFLAQLRQFQFEVLDSSFSNYGDTPFSISSILNMKYLGLKNYSYTDQNLEYCYGQIANNQTVKIFRKLGYQFINNSIFDIDEQSAPINKTFLISGKQLITSQTLFGRIRKDLYNNIIGKYFPNSLLYKKIVFGDLKNNELIYNKTISLAQAKSNVPRFVYSHLLLPHFPYYYDSSGRLNPLPALASDNLYNDSLYLGYLKYCNKYILDLINSILKCSKVSPVILLMSDHGYRKTSNYSYHSNLAAIHLPSQDYSGYRHNLSNVNQFAVLFNNLFHQRLVIRPDKIEE